MIKQVYPYSVLKLSTFAPNLENTIGFLEYTKRKPQNALAPTRQQLPPPKATAVAPSLAEASLERCGDGGMEGGAEGRSCQRSEERPRTPFATVWLVYSLSCRLAAARYG